MGQKLLNGATATGYGGQLTLQSAQGIQATVVGSGSVSATVVIEVSNDGVAWMPLGTITLSGTTMATDGFASAGTWESVRANLSAVSGTGAAVTVTLCG